MQKETFFVSFQKKHTTEKNVRNTIKNSRDDGGGNSIANIQKNFTLYASVLSSN